MAIEHAQRDAAWQAVLDAGVADDDVVLICDVDEIPSSSALAWTGPGASRAVDEDHLVCRGLGGPAVLSAAPYRGRGDRSPLRKHGGHLGAVRDARGMYPVITDGGWHFSWTGGVERQSQKPLTGTCHTELLSHPEANLILSVPGTGKVHGGGIPVVPVDVDESWPQWIRERKCPPEWSRPRVRGPGHRGVETSTPRMPGRRRECPLT